MIRDKSEIDDNKTAEEKINDINQNLMNISVKKITTKVYNFYKGKKIWSNSWCRMVGLSNSWWFFKIWHKWYYWGKLKTSYSYDWASYSFLKPILSNYCIKR